MIELKGMIEAIELQIIGATKLHKSLKEAVCGFIGQFFSISKVNEPTIAK
jgi:hypothetical protein